MLFIPKIQEQSLLQTKLQVQLTEMSYQSVNGTRNVISGGKWNKTPKLYITKLLRVLLNKSSSATVSTVLMSVNSSMFATVLL
jgi:hypothetical protein